MIKTQYTDLVAKQLPTNRHTYSTYRSYTSVIMFLLICFPASQSVLEKVEVEYVTMPGWKSSIAHFKSISDLPPNAKAYVEKLSQLTGVPSEFSLILSTLVQICNTVIPLLQYMCAPSTYVRIYE